MNKAKFIDSLNYQNDTIDKSGHDRKAENFNNNNLDINAFTNIINKNNTKKRPNSANKLLNSLNLYPHMGKVKPNSANTKAKNYDNFDLANLENYRNINADYYQNQIDKITREFGVPENFNQNRNHENNYKDFGEDKPNIIKPILENQINKGDNINNINENISNKFFEEEAPNVGDEYNFHLYNLQNKINEDYQNKYNHDEDDIEDFQENDYEDDNIEINDQIN